MSDNVNKITTFSFFLYKKKKTVKLNKYNKKILNSILLI